MFIKIRDKIYDTGKDGVSILFEQEELEYIRGMAPADDCYSVFPNSWSKAEGQRWSIEAVQELSNVRDNKNNSDANGVVKSDKLVDMIKNKEAPKPNKVSDDDLLSMLDAPASPSPPPPLLGDPLSRITKSIKPPGPMIEHPNGNQRPATNILTDDALLAALEEPIEAAKQEEEEKVEKVPAQTLPDKEVVNSTKKEAGTPIEGTFEIVPNEETSGEN
jgi:hypothetical protein